MELLTSYIYQQVVDKKLSQKDAKTMLLDLSSRQKKAREEIAIIGMASRLPGAKNLEDYWSNLVNGVNCLGDVPLERRHDCNTFINNPAMGLLAGTDTTQASHQGDPFVKGGFLEEIDKFDAQFFHIPPKEAKFMDPIHRLFLETAWEAIEDAGYCSNKIYGSKTGVFAGRDYTPLSLYKYVTEANAMHLTGSWTGILASRLSYIFNLQGPSMVIDTACSSGLVSIHMACEAIRNKECSMAIAGGININYMLLKAMSSTLDLSMVESDSHIVRTFDKNANGTVWGEGVCTVFLKPLSKALADGDNIHAVIRGSAINNDGASNGITAPNADAQEDVILRAWEEAGINPETITYTEAHGTGTVLGDPIEIKGLTNAFRRYTNKKQFCGIGSVKTSIGHTVAASGVASLIKVVLSMKNKKVPASLNFEEPNPYINFCDSPVYVNDRLKEWVSPDSPLRAGISSFGFSGTNCYMVIEEAPDTKTETEKIKTDLQVLTLSARSESVLRNLVGKYKDLLDKVIDYDIRDLCYTANTGRDHHAYRLALIAKNMEDLKQKIAVIGTLDFHENKEAGIYFGESRVVNANKKSREEGEITETEKKQRSKEINMGFRENVIEKNASFMEKICLSYVKGADIAWDEIYKEQKRKRVSLPVYPFEKVRYWAEPKKFESNVNTTEKEMSHPMLDRQVSDSMNEGIFVTQFNIDRHWVLKEHKLLDKCVVPGVAYLELAREACGKYYNDKNVVLKSVMLLSPLVVGEDEDIGRAHV